MTTQPITPGDQRISRLEGAYEQVNERLNDLAQGQASIRAEMTEGFASIRAEMAQSQAAIRSEMNSRFNAALVLMATLWATLAGGLMAIFFKG